jgi:hypothetical protein
MSASLLTARELFGLFELDGAGKILYYRTDDARLSPDKTGHNFYDEVAPFENVEEFRQCVTDFTRGGKVADSFEFDCHYNDFNHPIRVLLARICERVNLHTTKSVLVHIRQGITLTGPRNTEVNGNERDVD